MIETLEQYSPNFEENLSDRVSPVFIETRSGRVKILETNDFPTTDPWSEFFRETLKNLTEEGFFEGEEVVEFGIGDGRNELVIGNVGKIIGIDIDSWRLKVASENLKRCKITKNIPTDLYHQHAAAFLEWHIISNKKLGGRGIMCLPQSPYGVNHADTYSNNDNNDVAQLLTLYEKTWGEYGLTLNAAVLDKLRHVVNSDFRQVVILSDRITDEIKNQLFAETGWEVERNFKTIEPIQQDPDTPIGWVTEIDDEKRFFEKIENGFIPITAVIAEKRREESKGKRNNLNVYHDLSIYVLKPKAT